MAGGSFQTSREIFEHPIWQDVTKFRLFFYIYGQAVFSDDGVRVGDMFLKRGQYLRSYRNLSKDLEYIENRQIKSYSISTIKRTIDKLVKENRLLIDDTELGTLFTVVNYEEYQGFGSIKKDNLAQRGNSVGTEAEQSRNNNNNVKKEKKDNNKPSSPKFSISDMEHAKLLFQLMQQNNQEVRQPNYDKWADDFRLIRERDKRTDEQIAWLIRWTQNDEFWKSNILSPSKLRKQWDHLVLKAKAEHEKKKAQQLGIGQQSKAVDWEALASE